MPRLLPLVLASTSALLGAGCLKDNPAFYEGESASASGATGASSSSGDGGSSGAAATGTSGMTSGMSGGVTSGDVSSGDATTQPVSGSDGTTGGPGTSDASTSGGTSGGTAGDTTGGPMMCTYDVPIPPPRLKVLKDGIEALQCGGVVKTLGNAYVEYVGNTIRIHNSGNCAPGGSIYEVSGVGFTITPVGLGESCSSARLEWAAQPPCELSGFALKNGDSAVYVGGFGTLTAPEGFDGFSPAALFDCGCELDPMTCCSHDLDGADLVPGLYALLFPGLGQTLPAQHEAQGTIENTNYLFSNLNSHIHPSCEALPSTVWLDMRWWVARTG